MLSIFFQHISGQSYIFKVIRKMCMVEAILFIFNVFIYCIVINKPFDIFKPNASGYILATIGHWTRERFVYRLGVIIYLNVCNIVVIFKGTWKTTNKRWIWVHILFNRNIQLPRLKIKRRRRIMHLRFAPKRCCTRNNNNGGEKLRYNNMTGAKHDVYTVLTYNIL